MAEAQKRLKLLYEEGLKRYRAKDFEGLKVLLESARDKS